MLAIDKVLNYMDKYHMDLNIDAIFGLTLAEGLYTNWTSTDILKNREASYKGVPTDVCLEELLSNSKKYCFVSPLCKQMMLGIRNDTGYLLTHRLLYMQLLQLIDCQIPNISIEGYIRGFCSLIYKELKTSAHLNYPYHDKFLEQILLCGQEGFAEILKPHWLSEILTWQQPQGCFKSITSTRMTRSSNVIAFGCSDHSTGLGSGVLALYLRFLSV
ncbi:unnamed protein product [Brassicogethes aeneus]|uniref:Uncharacterized protein n=1 Tax=Brassicogethes aeneus TaxID=1431903 RepID=A0A9P0BHE3_BRAAE|nr:unnamed protein product [Brassicogethes aeneus]